MPLLLKFHGALGTVTGSCHFFKVKRTGTLCAVDCGATQGKDAKFQPAEPINLPADCRVEDIAHLLITHAHGDHVSLLIRWIKAGFKGEIICTKETAELIKIAVEDGLNVSHGNKKDLDIGKSEVDLMRMMVDAGRKCAPNMTLSVEPGLDLVPFNTSHLLGCVAFQVTATGTNGQQSTILYTGDIGPVEDADETQGLSPSRTQPTKPSDYIISESTYGDRPRDPSSRSGTQRIKKLAELLERGFRHGENSKVIIPAFSLQRTVDLLADVFHVINYKRGLLGLSSNQRPKIVVDSKLAYRFACIYDKAFTEGISGSGLWLNKNSGLVSEAMRHGDDTAMTLGRLLPGENKPEPAFTYTEDASPREPAIIWGRLKEDYDGPYVVICSSGMTNAGSILRYLRDYLKDERTTFVLSGYVQKESPGDILRTIAELPRAERASWSINIPAIERDGLPAINIPGDEIRAGYASISEYYSGHADGASISRYLFGESKLKFDTVKRVFLVHGEAAQREGLAKLLEAQSVRVAGGYPIRVNMPDRGMPWFDCDTDEWSQESEVRIQQYCVIPTEMNTRDALNCIEAIFKDVARRVVEDAVQITIRRGDRFRATIKARVQQVAIHQLRLSVETRYKGIEKLADASAVSFRWREVLNAIGADKERYFAGHRWCSTDTEIEELRRLSSGALFGGKQRRNGILIAGAAAISPAEREHLEAILTPNTPFFIIDDSALEAVQRFIFTAEELNIGTQSIIYIPIKCSDEPVQITRPFDFNSIKKLLELVGKDCQITSTRATTKEPPEPIAKPKDDALEAEPRIEPEDGNRITDRELIVGQKVRGTVDFVFHHAKDRSFIYALCKIDGRKKAAILHKNNVGLASFDCLRGDVCEYYVHSVSADGSAINLSLKAPSATAEKLLSLISDGKVVSFEALAKMLQITQEELKENLLELGIPFPSNGIIPQGSEFRIFNEVNNSLESKSSRQRSTPPPRPDGPTFSDISNQLGWDFPTVLSAAEHLLGIPDYYEIAAAILPAGFIPRPTSAFPRELQSAFITACRSEADKGWTKPVTIAGTCPLPRASLISVSDLANVWDMSADDLLKHIKSAGLVYQSIPTISPEAAKLLRANIIQKQSARL